MDKVHSAWKSVASSPEGQIILADMVQKFGFTRNPMFGPGVRIEDLVFREGQRSVLSYVSKMIDAVLSVDDNDNQGEL